VSEGSADHSGADQRNLLAGHGRDRFLCKIMGAPGPALDERAL
jgi:hypothetical protein